jgi:hypothetical protein
MDEESGSPPNGPRGTFRHLQQRRGVLAELDHMLRAYWEALVTEGQAFAEAALERAEERYAREGPPR